MDQGKDYKEYKYGKMHISTLGSKELKDKLKSAE